MSYQSWIDEQENPQLFERTTSSFSSLTLCKERWRIKAEARQAMDKAEEDLRNNLKKQNNEKDI